MSKQIDALTAIPYRFSIEGVGFRIKPHSPRVMGLVNRHFATAENPNGYQYAVDEIFTKTNLEVAAEFIYLCLDKAPKEFNDIDKFKELLLEKNKDFSMVNKLVTLCLKDVETDFEIGTSVSKKKVIVGLVMMTFAIIGLIASLSFLADLVSPIVSSWTSHLDKFSD